VSARNFSCSHGSGFYAIHVYGSLFFAHHAMDGTNQGKNETFWKPCGIYLPVLCKMVPQPVSPLLSVMLVIKHDGYRKSLGFALCHHQDTCFIITGQCGAADQAVAIFRSAAPSVVIIDASIRPGTFSDLAKQLKLFDRRVKIIAITNHYEQQRAELMLRQGAFAMISRDMDIACIRKAIMDTASADCNNNDEI
jgi:CheY-like chemotaxis protein